jgi:hypothetical protein
MFIEDPLNFTYSEGWRALRRATRVPILTGEKVEMVSGFRPYLDDGAIDYIHPDPAYAGGITGCRKIADYAALSRTPMALHIGPASLARFYAAAHIGGVVQNLFKIENLIGDYRGNKRRWPPGPNPPYAMDCSRFPMVQGWVFRSMKTGSSGISRRASHTGVDAQLCNSRTISAATPRASATESRGKLIAPTRGCPPPP